MIDVERQAERDAIDRKVHELSDSALAFFVKFLTRVKVDGADISYCTVLQEAVDLEVRKRQAEREGSDRG